LEIWEEAAQPQGKEEGVDGELRHYRKRNVLKIQVVRAEVSLELRRKVAQRGSAHGALGTDALADVLQLAINHKRTWAYSQTSNSLFTIASSAAVIDKHVFLIVE
jgi:hypothetical protein